MVRLGPEIANATFVRYIPDEHGGDEIIATYGSNRSPVGVLEPTRRYTVEHVEVHSWHTKVWLVDAGGPFNSVHFEDASE